MDRLVTILRAAHCRSTHHYFAIDALAHIATGSGNRLGQLLLKYHDEYLVGAKAPDRSFRDFQNHVLHVQDNYWGGAPRACEKWLEQTLDYLDAKKWKKAAYACGVLSHYFTDPFMPLHTEQSDRESTYHRPMEWSVCKSYEDIANIDGSSVEPIHLSTGDQWISKAVTQGAERANQNYNVLIDDYDLKKGCRRPPEGLGPQSRLILSELFHLTTTTWAKTLARIADQTQSDIPKFSLTLTTLLATIDMPLAWIVRRVSDASEQGAVKAILKEYEATGTVRRNLPAEIKKVAVQREKDRIAAIAKPASPKSAQPASPQDRVTTQAPTAVAPTAAKPAHTPLPTRIPEPNPGPPVAGPRLQPAPQTSTPSRRLPVTRQSDLVDAPSIGPKTAGRFEKIGVHTIGQFIDASAAKLCEQLATRWITEGLLVQWQEQAQLVCDCQSLCGYKAQLLVEAGCHDANSLADSDPSDLFQRVTAVCHSIDGQRILRSSTPPEQADVAEWISDAQGRKQTKRSQAA